MGKITAAQCNVNHQDQIWKDYVRKEQAITKAWGSSWRFLTDKYEEMRRKSDEAGLIKRRGSSTLKSEPLKLPPLQPPKQDSSRPFPKVTSHEVGWRSSREFSLEVFGRWGRPRYSIHHQFKWPHDSVP